MARIVKKPHERRSELIACAQKFFLTKGYERTTVSDIVEEIGVAKGTFYYYFDSKQDILEALVDDLAALAVEQIKEIIADESLPAITKWTQAFQVLNKWKLGRKEEMLAITRVLYQNENVHLQHKLRINLVKLIAPEFAKIIDQGIKEGVFSTAFVEESAEIALAILQTFSDAMADMLLNPKKHDNPASTIRRQLEAAGTAIERVLGAPEGALPLTNAQAVAAWFEPN